VSPGSSTSTTTQSAPGPSPPTGLAPVLQGYLQYPSNVEAVYMLPGDSGVTMVAATWTGLSELSLSSLCPTGQHSATGKSGLTIPVDDAGVGCTVTLKEPEEATGVASYVLSLDRPDSHQ
jgi:hypothetical protein